MPRFRKMKYFYEQIQGLLKTISRKRLFIPIIIWCIVFLGSYAIGFRLNYSPDLWQILWQGLLKDQPFSSIILLHSQPPGLNILHAFILHLPGKPETWFWLISFISGLVLIVSLDGIVRQLAPNARILPWFILGFVLLNPAFLLYSDWAFNTNYLVSLNCLLAWLFIHTAQKPNLKNGFFFSLVAMMMLMLRASYHPVWFYGLLVVIVLLSIFGKKRPALFLIGAMPGAILVTVLLLKNLLLFGFLGTSSWLGMNLYQSTTLPSGISPRNLFKKGIVSRDFLAGGFVPIHKFVDNEKEYSKQFSNAENLLSHPATGRPRTPTGRPNYNHLFYILHSRNLEKDVCNICRHYPYLLPRRIFNNCFYTLNKSPSEYVNLLERQPGNIRPFVSPWIKCHDFIVYGTWLSRLLKWQKSGRLEFNLSFFLFPLSWFTMVVVIIIFWRNLRKKEQIFYLYVLLTVAYHCSLIFLIDGNEGNRMRYEFEPLFFATLFCLTWRCFQLLTQNSGRTSTIK